MTAAATPMRRLAWTAAGVRDGERMLAVETPVALAYNGRSHAVMMATPADLVDFAIGFSLTEGIIDAASDIEDIRIVENEHGLVLRISLPLDRMDRLDSRQRRMAGPAGCGLCGIESLAEAARAPRQVPADARFTPAQVQSAVAALRQHQPLNNATRAVHAAGLWHPARGMVAVREDVGRHNALDKLAGALARMGEPVETCILVLSSRLSVELIQKAALIGAGVLAAISAPTTLALATAEAAGLTLIGIARDDGFELFTHPHRLDLTPKASVAPRRTSSHPA